MYVLKKSLFNKVAVFQVFSCEYFAIDVHTVIIRKAYYAGHETFDDVKDQIGAPKLSIFFIFNQGC